MTAEPIWFGSSERPLFGWLHLPDSGSAGSAVVLCPPVGRDYLQSHYAMRRLAIRLAERGFCVLRIDYDGTGDSSGSDADQARVKSWLASVGAAIEYMRRSGAARVSLVGMRFGATLAAVAAESDGAIEALVLWDPCTSGRTFLNEQRTLFAISTGGTPTRLDGSVETLGFVYSRATVSDLGSVGIPMIRGRLAARVLVLQRPDRIADRALVERLASERVDWDDATGQDMLIDTWAPNVRLPDRAIDRIGAWLSHVTSGGWVAFSRPTASKDATVARVPSGDGVIERPVFLGPTALFGVLTEIPDVASGPTILLLSVATEHHVGPARLWVQLARKWAAAGLRVVRLDISGVGESPVRYGQPEFVTYPPEAFDDVAEVAIALSPDDPSNVVLMGLCSSAYQAIEGALSLRPRGVVALNPMLSFRPPELAEGKGTDPRRQVALPLTALTQVFAGSGPLDRLRRRLPHLGWRARFLLARDSRPSKWLRELTGEVDLLLVCGDREARPFQEALSPRATAQLNHFGRFRFEYIPGLDHGLLVATGREIVSTIVSEHVVQRYGPARAHERLRFDVQRAMPPKSS